MALYQCLLLGLPTDLQINAFSATFGDCLNLFSLQRGPDYTIHGSVTADFSDTTATVAVSFGADGADYPERPGYPNLCPWCPSAALPLA